MPDGLACRAAWPAYSPSWPRCTATERSTTCSARKPATNISRAAGTPKTMPRLALQRLGQQIEPDHAEHQPGGQAEHEVAAVPDALGDDAADEGHREGARGYQDRHGSMIHDAARARDSGSPYRQGARPAVPCPGPSEARPAAACGHGLPRPWRWGARGRRARRAAAARSTGRPGPCTCRGRRSGRRCRRTRRRAEQRHRAAASG